MTKVRAGVSVVSQNTANNTTTISWSINLTPSKAVNASMTASLVIDGVTVGSYSGNPGYIGQGVRKVLASGTHTIKHNSDGTKTANSTVTARTNTQGSSWSFNVSHNNTHSLPRIARTSQPRLSKSAMSIGESATLYFQSNSSSFEHSATWNFGSNSVVITNRTSDPSVVWTLPSSFADMIPTTSSGKITIEVTTWSGSTVIGKATTSVVGSIPSSYTPTVTSSSLTDGKGHLGSVGAYLQNKSTVKITASANPSPGASITRYYTRINGTAYHGLENVIPVSGNVSVSVVAVDSRGLESKSDFSNISVLPYTPPAINLTIQRADSNGVKSPLGTYLRFSGTYSVRSIKPSTTERNMATVSIKYNLVGSPTKVTLWSRSGSTILSGEIPSPQGGGNLSVNGAYVVEVTVTDNVGTTTTRRYNVTSGETALSISKKGIGVGKIWEKGALDVRGDIYCEGKNINNHIIIDGVAYQASGIINVPSFSWARSEGNVHMATIGLTIPYTPPTGWSFVWSVGQSSGFTFVDNANLYPIGNTQNIRVAQFFNNSTSAFSKVAWKLVYYGEGY